MTRLRRTKVQAAQPAPAFVADPSTYPIASPWASSTMQRIVAEDVFGSDLPNNTREAAMRIPAVARARNLMVLSIAVNPLVALKAGQPLAPQPSWLSAAAGGTSPQQTIAWTVDDLMFYGWSCWWRNNGSDGFPLNRGRIPIGDWSINDDNRVEVNGQVVPDNAVILIPGMHEGILSYGCDAIRDTRTLYANMRRRLATSVPPIDLHQTGGRELKDEEIDKLIDRYVLARQSEHGGVGFTSKDITANVLATNDDSQLMIEARNAAAVECARIIGISAGLIDATTPKASLNYETKDGRNEEFVDRDLGLYMAPLAWRLSLDDVTPHGTYIAFDTSAFTGPTYSPTGPTLED